MSSGVTTPGSLTSPGSSSIPATSPTSTSPISTSPSSSTSSTSSSTSSTSSTTSQQSSISPITTTSTTVFTPPVTTSQSSTLPPSTSTTTFVTTPSSSTSGTSSQSSTSDAVTGSTSIAVSSGPSTIYSTTIVYVSGTDGRGSSYTSATAIGGGSGSGGNPGNNTNIGAIVGGVVGGVGGAALLGVLAFCFLRKRKRDNRDALDEKMFDPGRNTHSSNSPAPIDLLSDHPRTNQISPYTAGLSANNGYEGYGAGAAGIGAGAAAAAAYGGNSYAPHERYERPTGGSADSSAYTHGSDAYLINGGNSQAYSSSHGHGSVAGQDYLPGVGDHRLSGGWGVAAAGMGSPTQTGFGGGNGSGYTARDYANYSQNGPTGGQGSNGPYAAMMGAGAGAAYAGDRGRNSFEEQEQDQYRPRMSAGAMAKLREARGEDRQSRGSGSNRGSSGAFAGHTRGPSSNANHVAYGGHSDENYGVGHELDRRRSSAGLSGSGESSGHGYGYGDDGYGHGRRSSGGGALMVHNDGGPVNGGEQEEDNLPREIPPAYDAVPSDGRGQAL